jgi:hypothetical protein
MKQIGENWNGNFDVTTDKTWLVTSHSTTSILDTNQWHSYGKILRNEGKKAEEYNPS